MALLTVTNLSSSAPLLIQDIYTSIPASSSITVDRSLVDLPKMKSLQNALNTGVATLSVALSADELGSGLGGDAAPVAAASVQGTAVCFRVPMAAAGPTDIAVYAASDMPSNFRILDATLFVTTAVAASTVEVRSALAGGGVLYTTFSAAATGRIEMDATLTACPVALRASAKGLIVHKSNAGIAAELILVCRPEL